jgi:hypothetical protein
VSVKKSSQQRMSMFDGRENEKVKRWLKLNLIQETLYG